MSEPTPPEPDTQARQPERDRMVAEQLQQRGIRSPTVLDAMRAVPRELFVPPGQRGVAYHDGALPVDCGQTISQPYMVARMTELLELRREQVVLEIGTGTGYQTAVLAHLARHVYSIEWHAELCDAAANRLRRLGLHNVTLQRGDGSLGWPERAPFAGILVTAGAPDVPTPLTEQLTPRGRLVVPVGPAGDQTLVRLCATARGLQREDVLRCRFVKLVGEAGWDADG